MTIYNWQLNLYIIKTSINSILAKAVSRGTNQEQNYYRPIYINKTEISLGETPEILEA